MQPVLLNRISLVLSFVGFYIALVLSLEKALGLELPCGTDGGCSMVSSHPTAYWLDLPVAWYGLVGWLGILLLAMVRQSGDLKYHFGTIKFGLVLTLVGAVASIYLQFVSFTVIRAFCPYCFTQAVAMVGSFVAHFLLFRAAGEPGDEPISQPAAMPLIAGLAIVSIAGAAFQVNTAKQAIGGVNVVPTALVNSVELVPKDAYIYGDKDAPITIVEFADITCPMCQMVSPRVHEYVDQNKGRVRWVYRHFLIPRHQMASPAALAAEYAGTQGKFNEFLEIIMRGLNGQIPEEVGPIQGALRAANLDVEEYEKIVRDSSNPLFERIARDINDAGKLGVNSTPTFIVVAPGLPARTARGEAIFQLLQSEDYKKF